MMYVALHFKREDGTEARIETILPGTPNKGDVVTFYDSDREEELVGTVTFVHWRDLNGEILVHVHTKNAFGQTILDTP
jgi:hypothetical protein